MKKFFKALLFLIGIIVVLAGITATYIHFRSIPKYTPEKKYIKVEVTPARVEQGAKLASMLCKNCHYTDQTKKFTGRELTEVPMFGHIYSRNITQDPHAGIGGRRKAESVVARCIVMASAARTASPDLSAAAIALCSARTSSMRRPEVVSA